jgi:hypothetical protein
VTVTDRTETAPEKTVREHVTTLHLIGEQLSQIESWFWQHLADVREAATPAGPALATDRAALRERIAEALATCQGGTTWAAMADAVLAVLPAFEPALPSKTGPKAGSKAAVLLWAADQIDAGWFTTAATATAELRRLAGEAQQDEAPVDRTAVYAEAADRLAAKYSDDDPAVEDMRLWAEEARTAREAQQDPTQDDTLPAGPWEISYHQMSPARLNPGVCICGLGPAAVVHNEPPHACSSRLTAPHQVPVAGLCTLCHHHETAACHTPTAVARPGQPETEPEAQS